jgi:hypothetical protein
LVADLSLFITETPSGHDFYEASAITLSTTFYSAVDTIIDAARWWSSATYRLGTYELVLFEATAEDVPTGNGEGNVVASVMASNNAHDFPDDQWTSWYTFPAPVKIRGLQTYKIGLRTSVGAYTAYNSFFDTHSNVNGILVAPQTADFRPYTIQGSPGTTMNGTYTPDITSYPDQTFNATAYFVDARSPDIGSNLTMVGFQKVTVAGGAGALSLNVMPDAGDIVVVKMQTWDYTISMSLTDDTTDRLVFTRAINGNASGFVPWVGIDTATCAARPTSPITITSSPGSACRHSMTVEIWRNAAIGSAVVATRGSTDLSTSMSATAGSQISWVGSDSQSRDPANSTLVSGSLLDYTDDGHIGSNSVSYFGHHPVAATGSVTFGVAGNVTPGSPPTVNTFSGKVAGIEILHSTSSTTPVSQQFDLRWSVAQLASQQYDLRWSVSQLVGQQYDLRWSVSQTVSQQFDLRWSVAQRINAQYELQWQVAQTVARQFDFRWSVYSLVANQFDLRWTVIGRVKAQFSLKWSVDAFGPALPTKPIIVNRHTDALVINRRTGVDFKAERG